MADVPEPDYDEAEVTAPESSSSTDSKPLNASSASVTSTTSASDAAVCNLLSILPELLSKRAREQGGASAEF